MVLLALRVRRWIPKGTRWHGGKVDSRAAVGGAGLVGPVGVVTVVVVVGGPGLGVGVVGRRLGAARAVVVRGQVGRRAVGLAGVGAGVGVLVMVMLICVVAVAGVWIGRLGRVYLCGDVSGLVMRMARVGC